MLIWFLFFFHLKHENIFVSTKKNLKLCAIWINVNLGVVNRFTNCSANVLVVVEELVANKFNGNKKFINNCKGF